VSQVLNTTALIEGTADDVVLAMPRPGYLTVQIGTELTLLIDKAPADMLRAIGAAFDQAADLQDQGRIVALNIPAIPDYGTGAA